MLVAYNDPSGCPSTRSTLTAAWVARCLSAPRSMPALRPSGRVLRRTARSSSSLAATSLRILPRGPWRLKVFHFDAGTLLERSHRATNGVGFRSRHLDFARRVRGVPDDRGAEPLQISEDGRGAGADAVVHASTLSDGAGQTRTDGQHSAPASQGSSSMSANAAHRRAGQRDRRLRINEATGAQAHPERRHTRFTRGPSRSILPVVCSSSATRISVCQRRWIDELVPANLAVFRVGSNGTLTFVQRYDVAVARKPLWWMGIVASR